MFQEEQIKGQAYPIWLELDEDIRLHWPRFFALTKTQSLPNIPLFFEKVYGQTETSIKVCDQQPYSKTCSFDALKPEGESRARVTTIDYIRILRVKLEIACKEVHALNIFAFEKIPSHKPPLQASSISILKIRIWSSLRDHLQDEPVPESVDPLVSRSLSIFQKFRLHDVSFHLGIHARPEKIFLEFFHGLI